MSDSKKNAPKRRFEEFSNANDWEQRKLGDFTKLSQGLQIAIVDRYIEKGNNRELYITNEFLNTYFSKKYYIDNPAKNVIANEDDILMTRTGNTGKVITNVRGAFHNNFFKIDYNPIKTPKLFLYYILTSDNIQKEVLVKAGTSTIPDLNHNDFYNIVIQVPKIKEQQKIGTFFQQLDDTIALHRRKLEKIKALKTAYLSEMFPAEGELKPKRRFAGFTDEWEKRKLRDNGKPFVGLSGKKKEDFGHGGAKFVTYLNVFNNVISDLNGTESVEIDRKQTSVNYGDVLFTISSETPEDVGLSSIWLGSEMNIYLNSFCFGYRPTAEFDLYYLGFMLRSKLIRKEIALLAQGVSRYNLSKKKVLDIEVPIPSIEEQIKLGKIFKNVENLITLHQRKLQKLQNIKKAYLNEMFI
ncbi:restriction endonuclease subunit S [Listeria seeligeri]|uniref:restriction endonuclease subunit S n=1 Tax=Listeria seeligeri TaxID=1640 RepID=UPI001C89E0F7|nr:restriction endonuclease subunit S [Listeria seeligeri]